MFDTLLDLFDRDRRDHRRARRSGLRGMLDTVLDEDRPCRDARRRTDDHLHDDLDDELDSEHRRSTRPDSARDWD